MGAEVRVLKEDEAREYENYILQKEDCLIYVSTKYRRFLEQLLGDKSYYFAAWENRHIVGIMPSFIKENSKYGNVINSLPFYGSIGSVICDSQDVRDKLIEAYNDLARKFHCVASTIIVSPFERENNWYSKRLLPEFIDERIGQITFFPNFEGGGQELFQMFDGSVRWAIRKAQKSGVIVEVDNSPESIDFLYQHHVEGMKKIGGLAKEKNFFDEISHFYEAGKDFNIFVARLESHKIAACLLLYYNSTVEYFVPVTADGYRSYQPLSLILYEAMSDAMAKGFRRWNWGGTWLSQEGVYQFKRKWAAIDMRYYYYTNIMDKSILDLPFEEILENYKNYYVYPFNKGIDATGKGK